MSEDSKEERPPSAAASGGPSADELRAVCALLQEKSGHDFSAYKDTTLGRRLDKRLQACRIATVAEYLELLASDPFEAQALLRDLLISVTEFFRDRDAFSS